MCNLADLRKVLYPFRLTPMNSKLIGTELHDAFYTKPVQEILEHLRNDEFDASVRRRHGAKKANEELAFPIVFFEVVMAFATDPISPSNAVNFGFAWQIEPAATSDLLCQVRHYLLQPSQSWTKERLITEYGHAGSVYLQIQNWKAVIENAQELAGTLDGVKRVDLNPRDLRQVLFKYNAKRERILRRWEPSIKARRWMDENKIPNPWFPEPVPHQPV
jgi:hypothetical protein